MTTRALYVSHDDQRMVGIHIRDYNFTTDKFSK